jgi:hypothetical protein
MASLCCVYIFGQTDLGGELQSVAVKQRGH